MIQAWCMGMCDARVDILLVYMVGFVILTRYDILVMLDAGSSRGCGDEVLPGWLTTRDV